MNTYNTIILSICMLLYTIYAVWRIVHSKRIVSCIFGTIAAIAGSVIVYLIAPFIAAAILGLLKALCMLAAIAVILGMFNN